MTKYISNRLTKYFNESQANVLFKNPKRIKYHPLFFMARVVILYDAGKLSAIRSEYFICNWSSYLTLHYNNSFVIEPYFSNKFSRQFGFYQQVPHDFGRKTWILIL